MFDKDVTTLLLQIGTSSGGFEHPVLKCSSLPKNALEGGLNPLALPPHHKGIFSGEIFLEFVEEAQFLDLMKFSCYVKLASIETTWSILNWHKFRQIIEEKVKQYISENFRYWGTAFLVIKHCTFWIQKSNVSPWVALPKAKRLKYDLMGKGGV